MDRGGKRRETESEREREGGGDRERTLVCERAAMTGRSMEDKQGKITGMCLSGGKRFTVCLSVCVCVCVCVTMRSTEWTSENKDRLVRDTSGVEKKNR